MTDLRKILAEATPGPWRYKLPFYGSDEYDTGFFILGKHPKVGSVSHASVRYGCDEAKELGNIKANARLIALTPQLAAALIKAEEAMVEATEIVHKEYVRATLDAVNAGPSHPLQKQMDAWRVRCMNAEKVSRAALSEIRALTGGNDD